MTDRHPVPGSAPAPVPERSRPTPARAAAARPAGGPDGRPPAETVVSGPALRPLPLADVEITDAFWAPRREVVRTSTLPAQLHQLRTGGQLEALKLTWKHGQEPVPHIFWESDVAKWIEAASYSLATHPDPELEREVDEAVELLAGAQQDDGYLNTYFTVVEPGKRFTDLRDAHELYCAGHLIEAGVAHFEATGKRRLLDVVSRYADLIAREFGTGPGQKRGYDGHEEIELALVKLHRATGERRYLDLATYFVDERGQEPYYFDLEAQERGTTGYFGAHFADREAKPHEYREYLQAHAPVREQTEAVGHSVRAMYLYSAMADLARENGDASLLTACRTLWHHLTSTRMYLTGGIGSSTHNEGFTSDFDLPDADAYAETCAAIGLVFWAQRLALLERDASYADVLERALYNGVLSGLSGDGTCFFYDNPLASDGGVHRQEWFGVACCPPNLARLLSSLGAYAYAASAGELAVSLYLGSTARAEVAGTRVVLTQTGDYPWDGAVRLGVGLPDASGARFTLLLRVPGWSQGAQLSVNGEVVDLAAVVERGYARLEREWGDGDTVELVLAMDPRRTWAHPAVASATGRVALERGPLVYCLEEVDHKAPVDQLGLPRGAALDGRRLEELGVLALTAAGVRTSPEGWDGVLYRAAPPQEDPTELTAVPYFSWDNRAPGTMRVWVRDLP